MGVDADIDRIGRPLVTTTTTQKPLEVHELDRRLAGRAMDRRMEKYLNVSRQMSHEHVYSKSRMSKTPLKSASEIQ